MTGNEALLTFALIAGGFLLGGVMFSRALPKLLTGKDVCALRADKNPGAANVFAVCGVPMGLLCLALDMFKAYLPARGAVSRHAVGLVCARARRAGARPCRRRI